MQLRRPEKDDLPRINGLILRSKQSHGYDDNFMAACITELTLTVRDLDTDELMAACDGDRLLGIAQLSFANDACELEKLFVEPGAFGHGVGKNLFCWAKETAVSHGATQMLIDSDPGAVKFYLKMGASRNGTSPSGSVPGRLLPHLKLDLTTPAAQLDRSGSGLPT